MKTKQQYHEEGNAKLLEAKALQEMESFSAEDVDRRDKLIQEGMHLKEQGNLVQQMVDSLKQTVDAPRQNTQQKMFRSLGHYLFENWKATAPGRVRAENVHPYFIKNKQFNDPSETQNTQWITGARGQKDMVESIGASGGFLVFPEFRAELLSVVYEDNPIRSRATVMPMRAAQITLPTLDQTGTTAGQTRQHGGIVASWTPEAGQKSETQPSIRQITLAAHKLVCYTEASDELLADSAISLAALLSGEKGYGGAIKWEEEYTFLRGSGAGEPQGVIGHAGTKTIARTTAAHIEIDDIFALLAGHTGGGSPMWSIQRGAMAEIFGLNGPSGNPSYVFIDNARDGLPARLFGYPIQWTEKLPALGTEGDILLADWSSYLIGDRQLTTIDSSMHYRFQYDLTSWRAVHRVGGQPWLSAVITLADGSTTISPFVTLTDAD